MRKLVLTLAALIAVATFIQANSKPGEGNGNLLKNIAKTTYSEQSE